jgi:hypothetical protein
MKYHEIYESVKAMTDLERHRILDFMYTWLRGSYMGDMTAGPYLVWKEISTLFPVKVTGDIKLYRLVTVPVDYAEKKEFSFRPAPGKASSWCKNIAGLDYVAGIAYERNADVRATARVAISAIIPAKDILATPTSIRKAVLEISKDYFTKYPDKEVCIKRGKQTVPTLVQHPDYPGGQSPNMDLSEVDFLRSIVQWRGGYHRQHECVVETPERVVATMERIYRLGNDDIRAGKEE